MVAVIVLLSIAAGCVVLYCLLGEKEVWDLELGQGFLTQLNRRKAQLIRALKDLDMERETGSLTEEEYVRTRNEYKRRVLRVMEDLDRARSARIRHLKRAQTDASNADRRRVENELQKRKRVARESQSAAAMERKS